MALRALRLVVLAGLTCGTAEAQELGPCSGPPQPEQEPNDTPATATALTLTGFLDYMTRAPGSIGVPGDVDYFRVQAPAGAHLDVLVDTAVLPQDPGSTTRDSVVQVLGADGVILLEQDDDDGTGIGSVVSGEASAIVGLQVTGTIYIRVAAKNPGDVLSPYLLWVHASTAPFTTEVEPNNTQTTFMALSEPVLGELSTASDVDWYMRNFLGGGPHAIFVDGDPERDGTTTDVRIESAGQVGTINSSFGPGSPPPGSEAAWSPSFHFGFPFAVVGPAAGTYAIRVAYIGGDTCQVPVELISFEVR
jgi:hypothetical protein